MSSDLECAVEFVRRAVDEDVNGHFLEAFKQYQNSADCFLLALKYERNESSKRLIWLKLNEYVTRAERVRQHLVATGVLV